MGRVEFFPVLTNQERGRLHTNEIANTQHLIDVHLPLRAIYHAAYWTTRFL